MAVENLPLTNVFIPVGIILLFSLLLSLFFKRLGQNPVLGFILSGFLLGPFVLNFLNPAQIQVQALVHGFAELGLFVLLFYLGIELSVRDFLKAGIPTLGLAVADMVALALLGFVVASLAGFSLVFSAAVALMVLSTSSAIVGKFMLDRNLLRERSAQMALAVLILQDFLGILLLVFVSSFSKSGSAFLLGLTAAVFALVSFFAVHRISGIAERFFEKHHTSSAEITLYALGVGLVSAVLAGFLDLSPAIGAYFAGFALSELKASEKIKHQISFLRDFFLLFFFVSFGSTLFFDASLGQVVLPPTGELLFLVGFSLLVSLGTLVVHAVALTVVGPLFNLTNRETSEIAVFLTPLGEFVIIIALAILPLVRQSNPAEALLLSPVAFLLILFTLFFFQPLYKRLDWHDRVTRRIPALAPRPKLLQPLPAYDSETRKLLGAAATNLLLVICLGWIIFLLYQAIPSVGIPVPYGRLFVAVVVFVVLGVYPFRKTVRALRKLWHLSCHNPNHHHSASQTPTVAEKT